MGSKDKKPSNVVQSIEMYYLANTPLISHAFSVESIVSPDKSLSILAQPICLSCGQRTVCNENKQKTWSISSHELSRIAGQNPELKPGQKVTLQIHGDKLVQICFITYGLPILGLFFAVGGGIILGIPEYCIVISSLMGMLSGSYLASCLAKRIKLPELIALASR
jgi:positive regulator of sigma E activity